MSKPWTYEELETLEEMSELYTLKQIAYRLKRRGYHRTTNAISKKLTALGYSTRPLLDNYTCSEIAKTLCLHSTTVSGWVKRGWLKAMRRSTKHYQIKSEDLKRFLENPPQRIRNRIAAIDQQAIRYLVG
ncbi:MAG: hypothetical protein KME59_14530 [Trichormus sp. ATA11-4-KO1]|jgi:excisionase family DNA binding protein|nr:hypothetical protein [Trichormus sp. ATA11-4-KO1]